MKRSKPAPAHAEPRCTVVVPVTGPAGAAEAALAQRIAACRGLRAQWIVVAEPAQAAALAASPALRAAGALVLSGDKGLGYWSALQRSAALARAPWTLALPSGAEADVRLLEHALRAADGHDLLLFHRGQPGSLAARGLLAAYGLPLLDLGGGALIRTSLLRDHAPAFSPGDPLLGVRLYASFVARGADAMALVVGEAELAGRQALGLGAGKKLAWPTAALALLLLGASTVLLKTWPGPALAAAAAGAFLAANLLGKPE